MTYVAQVPDDVTADPEPALDETDAPLVLGRLGLDTSPADRVRREADAADAPDGSERRRRLRKPDNKSVKLFDPASERYFAGHTCDVSETGLCLTLPARLPLRNGATACLYVADDRSGGLVERTQMLDVRFVWVRRDEKSGTATCGVERLTDTAGARGSWAADARQPSLRAA